jgi:glycosyltransferase involved in cell wall biosynthesis
MIRRLARRWWDYLSDDSRATVRRYTLRNYFVATHDYWPELRTADRCATALVLFLLRRFHSQMLRRAWQSAGWIRNWRRSRTAVSVSPLRVLHVTSSFDLGGTQRQIKQLCLAPTARFEHHTTEIFPELNFLYRRGEALQTTRYVRGGLFQRAVGRCAANFSTRSWQMVQAYKLLRDFKAYRPDVVVGWGHEMCATSFLAAAIARVPHVVFCIRTFNPAYGWADATMGRLLGTAHRVMTPHLAVIITNSTPLRDDHARWIGIDPARIEVCANGIELVSISEGERQAKQAAVRQELNIAADARVAINVGRFSAEKGQHTIVAINNRLMRDYGDGLVWLLCGDGPTLPAVRGEADAAGMTNIRFLGRVTAVRDLLCASDIFVMPSDFEGMPNAMMEAMACGLPCVSTDRSGAVDVARHGQEALFYKVGDLAAMEQQVRFLLDHPDEARAMGRRARARLDEFSVERSLTRFEEIIEHALGRAARQDT